MHGQREPGETSRQAGRATVQVPDYAVLPEVVVDPARTALVVVDMQNDFVRSGGGLLVPDAEATLPAIKRLLEVARANQTRIVFSQDTHHEGDREWQTWPEHCREGTWGWEIVLELAPRAGDTVIRKLRHDVFYATPLEHLLRLWDVDTLVICGTIANMSVEQTAVSAAQRWYSVIVPRDAISALEPFDLQASLRQIEFVCAGRITTAHGVRMQSADTSGPFHRGL